MGFKVSENMSTGNRMIREAATKEDLTLFDKIERELYTAVISDSLDELGYRDQAMSHSLRPLYREVCVAGWARTVLCVDVEEIPEDPYAMEIEAVDSLLTGEVAVVSTGGSIRNAPWGELLSTAAMARGARGAVVDGLVRDVRKIEKIGFPVFATGIKPVDSKGRGVVVNYNVPVVCGGVNVFPGDLIAADYDGIVAVPAALVPEVLERAFQKVSSENHSREELVRGAFLRDVYEKYGVL